MSLHTEPFKMTDLLGQLINAAQPHAELHTQLGRIIDLKKTGNVAEAHALLHQLDHLSDQVVSGIDKLQEELHHR